MLTCALALAGACGEVTSPEDELSAARQRWESWGPASYDLVVRRNFCECSPEMLEPIVIAVRNGAVSRYHLDDGQPVVEPGLQYPDVPGLFDLVETEMERSYKAGASYDPVTGAPLGIFVDRTQEGIDDEFGLIVELRGPGPLPSSPSGGRKLR